MQFFAIFGCGSKATGPAPDDAMVPGDSLKDGMAHCHDVRTGSDPLSNCLASRSFVNRTLL